MGRKSINMCEGPLLKNTLVYALPVMLTGLLQLAFNAADLMVVGQFCGSISVAAVGATGSIIGLIVFWAIGISNGVSVTVAQGLGAQDHQEVHQAVHTSIPLSVLGGAFVMALGLLGAEPFLRWMGTPEDVLPLSVLYMRVYCLGMIPNMVYNYGAAILRAAGNTRDPLVFLTISGVVNVLLNVLFVTALHMDVAGVSLATSLSNLLAAVLVMIALCKRKDDCGYHWKQTHIYKKSLLKILRIGLPAGLQSSMFSISNVILQSSINSFGSVVMSGNAASVNLENFAYTANSAFYTAALNFVGQNKGAKKYDRIGKVLRVNLTLTVVTGVLAAILFYLCADSLLSLYISDSAEAIAYGVNRLRLIGVFVFLAGMMDVMTGAMRGMGVSLVPLVISVLGICGFRIVWIFTVFQIPAFHTLQSLYLSYPLSWAVTFVAQCIAYLLIRKRMDRQLAEELAQAE